MKLNNGRIRIGFCLESGTIAIWAEETGKCNAGGVGFEVELQPETAKMIRDDLTRSLDAIHAHKLSVN